MSTITVQEVFGQFAISVDGKIQMFTSRADAEAAAVLAESGEAIRAEAKAFTDGLNLDGKNAVGKQNVVTAYLVWVEAGRPEAEAADDSDVEAGVSDEGADEAGTVEL